MSIKIDGDKFYVLAAGNEKWIYRSERDAIVSLREMLVKKKELGEEDISILEINIKGEKWQIKQIPWSKIAIALIRGEL
ncbi:hypothetical protein DRO56_02920 [Candidatus Bathyarchaeota archaeon]|nr:MAG: hypothetical protein DRO56_02920 [Candidatus Bathyarchaeota archaeon]